MALGILCWLVGCSLRRLLVTLPEGHSTHTQGTRSKTLLPPPPLSLSLRGPWGWGEWQQRRVGASDTPIWKGHLVDWRHTHGGPRAVGCQVGCTLHQVQGLEVKMLLRPSAH